MYVYIQTHQVGVYELKGTRLREAAVYVYIQIHQVGVCELKGTRLREAAVSSPGGRHVVNLTKSVYVCMFVCGRGCVCMYVLREAVVGSPQYMCACLSMGVSV